jgi:hypothetical protein
LHCGGDLIIIGRPDAAVIGDKVMDTPTWAKGTDLRGEDGCYRFPPAHLLVEGEQQFVFPSVTTILAMLGADFRFAEHYFAAEYVAEAAKTAIEGQQKAVADIVAVLRSDQPLGNRQRVASYVEETFEKHRLTANVDIRVGTETRIIPAIDALCDVKWISQAGPRGMTRRANRGQIVHDAVEEWVYAFSQGFARLSADDEDLIYWVGGRIEDNGYYCDADECIGFVQEALRWLEQFVEVAYMAEAPVFNFTYGYAGTTDLMAKLKGLDGIWRLDFKSSSKMTARTEHFIQLAAYNRAEFYGLKSTGELLEMPPADHLGNVYVCPDERKNAAPGSYRAVLKRWPVEGHDRAFDIFVRLREVWQLVYRMESELNGTAVIVKPLKVSSETLVSTMQPRPKRVRKSLEKVA